MNNEKITLHILSLLSLVGAILIINDWKISVGIILFLFSNNINRKIENV